MVAQRRKKQSHAILVIAVFLSGVVVTCSTVSASVADPNDLRWDLAGGFKLTWDSAELSARAVNPAGKAKDLAASPRTLSISATLDILDANDLVAMCIATPVAFEALDEEGNDVKLEVVSTDLRLYDELRVGVGLVPRVYPFTLSIRVQFADGQVLPSKLSSLQAYIYAMYAEETIKVAVPFVETALDLGGRSIPQYDPQVGWINVAPDLQIRVIEAYACGDFYDYVTEVRSLTGVVGSLRIPTHGGTGDWVGDYVAIKTNLSGKSITAHFDNDVGSSPYMRFVAMCTGSLGYRGSALHGYDKIRHTIAIHPVEVKIPFELKDIPIPSVEPVVR